MKNTPTQMEFNQKVILAKDNFAGTDYFLAKVRKLFRL
jgi:hypothetical protein